jgi:zinc/manganese transport system permease protein
MLLSAGWLEVFEYAFMRNAFMAGTLVAVTAGIVGYFVVLRRLAFAGHALAHIGFAGATGAVFLNLNLFVGLAVFTTSAGIAMGILGDKVRGRDVAIGTVLALTMGLGNLFLSLSTKLAGEATSILFGDLLAISWAQVQLTLGFAVFCVASLTLLVFGSRLGEAMAVGLGLGDRFAAAWSLISIPLAAILVLTGIALIYYVAPAIRHRWRWLTPGSVLAVSLWLLASTGLRLYVNLNSYSATYGSIGGVILLLLWLYVMGIVLLVGAHVNVEIETAAAACASPVADHRGERAA